MKYIDPKDRANMTCNELLQHQKNHVFGASKGVREVSQRTSFFEGAKKTGETAFDCPVFLGENGIKAIACTPEQLQKVKQSIGEKLPDAVRRFVFNESLREQFPALQFGKFSAHVRFVMECGLVVCSASAPLAITLGLTPWWKEKECIK